MFTRLGYFVIIAILAVAGAAIAIVAYSAVSSDGNGSATAPTPVATVIADATVAAGPPTIPFSRVIDFTRFGSVISIEQAGSDVTVVFREDFDTSGFNTTSHVFKSSLEPGQDAVQVLEAAGIRVNGDAGVTVTQR